MTDRCGVLRVHVRRFVGHRRLRRCSAVAGGVIALLACAAARADSATPSGNFTLGAGDRIVVTVVGQPDLSGEQSIDSAGEIVLPFIGPVRVEGLTIDESQELICRRLAAGYLAQPVVGLRVSEPRPIYVFGNVRTPGAYPFRYGSVVESAVAAAGGFGIVQPLQGPALSEAFQAEQRLDELLIERGALVVRQARLQAQLAGRDTFSVPVIPEFPPGGNLQQIVDTERATMTSQADVMKATVELLRTQQPRLTSEIQAIKSETATEQGRLDFIHSEIERASGLLRQGLDTRTSSVQLKLEDATQQSNLWRLKAEMSRLERERGDLEIKIQDAELALKKEDITELQTVRTRLAELDVLLPMARRLRDWTSSAAGVQHEQDVGNSITVTRVRGGVPVVTTVSETAPLEPGDIVDVEPVRPGVPQLDRLTER
jgi:polysaccharide export outer membrane protein